MPAFEEINVEYEAGRGVEITLHNGSRMRLRKLEEEYNPRKRIAALTRLAEAREKNEVLTGLYYWTRSSRALPIC